MRTEEEREAHLLTRLTTKQNQFEASQVHKRHTELAWHTGQAVLLATELKVGMPCSVCGSREHPLPARAAEV
jgi:exonuclease SbcC